MSDDHSTSDNTPPSDLALADKMLTSNSPSASPPSAAALRETAAQAADDIAILPAPPLEPGRPAPPAPEEVPGSPKKEAPVPIGMRYAEWRLDLDNRRRHQLETALRRQEADDKEALEQRAQLFTCPGCGLRVVENHVCAVFDSDEEVQAPPRSPVKRFRDGLVKRVKKVAFRGVVDPETDGDEGGEVGGGEFVMSGGLGGNDASERGDRAPYKSNVLDDVPAAEEPALVDQPLLADNATGGNGGAEEPALVEQPLLADNATGGNGGAEESSKTNRSKATGKTEHEKRGKETIRLTRRHKRNTTGHGTAVESESETEYYESSGPANGCVVAWEGELTI